MTENECRRVLNLPLTYILSDAKKAYRKQVLITHPDRNQGDNSRFLLVQAAFEKIQIYIADRQNPIHQTKTTYQRRAKADFNYKQKVKRDIDWKKYDEEKEKRYIKDYKENIQLGCLAIAIIMLICIMFGQKYDPNFNGTKKQNTDYDPEND